MYDEKDAKRILIVGGRDTGKTTYFNDLFNELRSKKKKPILISIDPGQNEILPSTLPVFCDSIYFLFFYPGTNPLSHNDIYFYGIKKVIEFSLRLGDRVVIIDTPGIIETKFGKIFLNRLMTLFMPDLLIDFSTKKNGKTKKKSKAKKTFLRRERLKKFGTSPISIPIEYIILGEEILNGISSGKDGLKLAFQAVFGGTHLLENEKDTYKKLAEEYDKANVEKIQPLLQLIDPRGIHYRLNICVFKRMGLTFEFLWKLFKGSQFIEGDKGLITDFTNVLGMEQLNIDKIPHHSDEYITKNEPSYIVIAHNSVVRLLEEICL